MEFITLEEYEAMSLSDRLRYSNVHPEHAKNLQRLHDEKRAKAAADAEYLTADDVAGRKWQDLDAEEKRKIRTYDPEGAAEMIREKWAEDERRARANDATGLLGRR